MADYSGMGVIKWDTRSLDYSSNEDWAWEPIQQWILIPAQMWDAVIAI